MGVTLHACTGRQLLDRMFAALDWGLGGWVVTANLDILRQIVRDPEVRELAGEASLVVADGMPLVWASRLARTRPLERVAGSSLIDPLCEMSVRARRSVFFLGGSPGTAEAAARVMTARHPGLRIAGTYCPPYGFEGDDGELAAIRAQLLAARPDIVLVGLGCPKQERLIRLLRADLPRSWFLGVGVSFSFIAGEVRRAPLPLQNLGLEWLHRVAQEPRRLSRRYLVDGLPFAGRLGVDALRRRVATRRAPVVAARQIEVPDRPVEDRRRSLAAAGH